MYFKDREAAAYQLLEKLEKYRGKNPIVAGIPRGAMPMAKIIADGLGAELDAVLVHKIPHPENEEFAIGCVGISGNIHRLPYVEEFQISESYIQSAAKTQLETLKERQKKYGLGEPKMKDRIVIIVDDGIATGATTIGAISEVRSLGASKIILAAAVSATSAAREIKPLVDEFIVLDIPSGFFGVGQFFLSFPQVSDEEVIAMLHGENSAQV
ncbi:MAG: phosphoribosyltransferase family protein [Bacteriovorax sp.]|nr:phosphoribosyltransferase family protein [Bacteriovorax sp.]